MLEIKDGRKLLEKLEKDRGRTAGHRGLKNDEMKRSSRRKRLEQKAKGSRRTKKEKRHGGGGGSKRGG